ncbi:hypothetical protein M8J75_012318 [Diaphorina citri]|nr:hypothetical protein M8J75_012318 [Diaphorina citri]
MDIQVLNYRTSLPVQAYHSQTRKWRDSFRALPHFMTEDVFSHFMSEDTFAEDTIISMSPVRLSIQHKNHSAPSSFLRNGRFQDG